MYILFKGLLFTPIVKCEISQNLLSADTLFPWIPDWWWMLETEDIFCPSKLWIAGDQCFPFLRNCRALVVFEAGWNAEWHRDFKGQENAKFSSAITKVQFPKFAVIALLITHGVGLVLDVWSLWSWGWVALVAHELRTWVLLYPAMNNRATQPEATVLRSKPVVWCTCNVPKLNRI